MLPRDGWLLVAWLWGSPVRQAHLYGMPHTHAAQSGMGERWTSEPAEEPDQA